MDGGTAGACGGVLRGREDGDPGARAARTRCYRCRPTGRNLTALNTIAMATALYHGFPERIVARIPVTALLQTGYTVRDNFREYADKS
jgi:hypothetical protein